MFQIFSKPMTLGTSRFLEIDVSESVARVRHLPSYHLHVPCLTHSEAWFVDDDRFLSAFATRTIRGEVRLVCPICLTGRKDKTNVTFQAQQMPRPLTYPALGHQSTPNLTGVYCRPYSLHKRENRVVCGESLVPALQLTPLRNRFDPTLTHYKHAANNSHRRRPNCT